ncbi:hypothetical protein [uncultured Chitinophaga sp.]|uniref:HYC_CC_PP family protein n=1 Tax=uncultured Chitinophaga sp. TaxID=339340 RepID=UPI002626AA8A|nr:hypothetical protein [uncultured Chitinophaga sp.]
MKRFIAVILTFIYLGTAMGANVQLHYCMGKLVKWELGSEKKDLCDFCGMKKGSQETSIGKKKCCEDEYKELKLKKDQRAAENIQPFLLIPTVTTPTTAYTLPDIKAVSLATEFPVAAAPPGTDDVPVFLLHCNFRI